MQTLLAVVFSSAGCANIIASQNLLVCVLVCVCVLTRVAQIADIDLIIESLCVSYSNSLFICVFKKYFFCILLCTHVRFHYI